MTSTLMTSTKGKRPLRHLTASDKIDAIQRIHDGESKASVARDIGVPESTLRGWCKNEEKLRHMSRQSTGTSDSKMMMDKLSEKIGDECGLLSMGGPPEKRSKLDTSLPMSFGSNGGKYKFDELNAYTKARNSLSGLDFSTSKGGMGGLNFNGLTASDYSNYKSVTDLSALNGKTKDYSLKNFGADLSSKPADTNKSDLSMAAISPLTSLSHLSGMSGLGQSPLALSFNEIASNLNLIAQLNNSNLSGMSGLSGMNGGSQTNALRNIKPINKNGIPTSMHSPRSDTDHAQGLTVKNLAKLQQKSTKDHLSSLYPGPLDLNQKNPKPTTAALSRDTPVDDTLWYWLKSQQAMLGLNNLYSAMPSSASPHRLSPNQISNNISVSGGTSLPPVTLPTSTPPPQMITSLSSLLQPPIASSTPQTTNSTTPSGISEDTKNSSWFWHWYKTLGSQFLVANKQNTLNNNQQQKSYFDNILYAQLTKGQPDSPSDAINNNNSPTSSFINYNSNKPEDLSQSHNRTAISPTLPDMKPLLPPSNTSTPKPSDIASDNIDTDEHSLVKDEPTTARYVLDSLFKNQPENLSLSCNSSGNNDNNATNNYIKSESDDSEESTPEEAVEHGERFLKWLESFSDPSITAMQVMQFRTLLNSVKMSTDRVNNPLIGNGEGRSRTRRRK